MNIKNNQYIIIGSGPSGVSCATALLKKNIKVLMIDSGNELEKNVKNEISKLFNLEYEDWPKDVINKPPSKYYKGIPLKQCYGSNFIYKISDPYKYHFKKNIGLRPSFAKGGFSNIWGAAIMPCNKNDIADWPIKIKSLSPFYKEVMKLFDVSAQKDNLLKYFPIFKKKLINLNLSEQGEIVHKNLKKNEKQLLKNGFFFGRSRLAFNKTNFSHKKGCIYCGSCLIGCPKKVIYSSLSTLKNLEKNKNFNYLPGITVTSLKEEKSEVFVNGIINKSKKKILLKSKKVFVGAGVLQTTLIIANTLKLKEYNFEIKDKTLVYLPLLLNKSIPNIYNSKINTLAQFFFEIKDKKLSEKFIHAQLYLYNQLYNREINKFLFPLKLLFPKFLERLTSKLAILQIYLPSSESSKIVFKYNSSNPYKFDLKEKKNKNTKKLIKKVLKKIKLNKSMTGLYPLTFLNKVLPVGHSFHSGGTLPMSKKKNPRLCSDILGRPNNLKRIHCIDASVLPSIPSTTVTLTVMANAFRIGSKA